MRGYFLSVALCAPLVALTVYVARNPSLVDWVIPLSAGVGLLGGWAFCWLANRGERSASAMRMLIGSTLVGVTVVVPQYALVYLTVFFVLFSPFYGILLGGLGALIYMAVEKPQRGKEDAHREDRYQKSIQKHRIDEAPKE